MIVDDFVAASTVQWPDWFDGQRPDTLSALLLAGGPAHPDRISLLLFVNEERTPRAIMKIGFNSREVLALSGEHEALSQVWPVASAAIRDSIPRALGVVKEAGATAVVTEVVDGKRLLIPRLTGDVPRTSRWIMDRFFDRTFTWSRTLAESTSSGSRQGPEPLLALVDDFRAMFYPDDAELEQAAAEFSKSIESAGVAWSPAWQHCDVAVGNVLEDRGKLRFVDWEHASGDAEPWFDIAYAPIATSHLAMRVDGLPSLRDASLALLSHGSPIGSILRRHMSDVWDYPLAIPTAVTLTTMRMATRRRAKTDAGSPEWAEMVRVMLCDDEFRQTVEWLAPRW